MNTTNTHVDSAEIAELKPLSPNTIKDLLFVTQDSIDAMRLASDLYAMGAFVAEQSLAEKTGACPPKAPRPRSKFLRGFVSHLEQWFNTMAHSLRPDEIQRLKKIWMMLALRFKDEPGLLLEEMATVVTMAPPFAVLWLRSHFDEIEAKVAS